MLQQACVSIKERYRLNHASSEKETYHIVLDLADHPLAYSVGDCVGIYPTNDPAEVAHLLKLLQASGQEIVTDRKGKSSTLLSLLSERANLSKITQKLCATLGVAEKESLLALLQETGPALPQLLADHLLPLMPRLYSIASSMKEVGAEIHLTIKVTGTCSDFLCHRAPLHEPLIPIYLHKAKDFTLPTESHAKPIIMIGPGTGIAPFRGFMQERLKTQAHPQNWLFFGERSHVTDFYYQDYWKTLEKQGMLRLETAFSRDQAEKVYVQHKMLQFSKELWNWLEKGAYLYVCGDASRMAKDVETTLLTIFEKEGGQSPEMAKQTLKTLRKEKRYLRDVY